MTTPPAGWHDDQKTHRPSVIGTANNGHSNVSESQSRQPRNHPLRPRRYLTRHRQLNNRRRPAQPSAQLADSKPGLSSAAWPS
jgi:hypothetical protein